MKVKRVLGGGGYDRGANFEFLEGCGIEAGIKVRGDSDGSCGGAREKMGGAYLKEPPGWKEGVGYGRRWMVEGFFLGRVAEVVAEEYWRLLREKGVLESG